MKWFLVLAAAVLAVTAIPLDREIDLGKEGDFYYVSPNATSARVPWGQAGFATLNGGTWGGEGGAVWTVWDPWALVTAITGNDRRIVIVRGRLDMTQIFTGSPGVFPQVGSWKTIQGGDAGAMIYGGGLRLRGVTQVIITDLRIHNALSYAPGEQPNGNGGIISMVPGAYSFVDNIAVDSSTQVWINHCELSDDPWNAAATPENQRRHNGLLNIYNGANFVSVSNTIFRNHNMVILVGAGENTGGTDIGRLKTTWYLNWFQGTVQRNPLVRWAENHIMSNLYSDISSYGIGVWTGGLIYSERNAFVNCRRAWGWASSPNPNPIGNFLDVGSQLTNSGFDSGIPNAVHWRPSNYYSYGLMQAWEVENHVRRYAGPR